MSDKDTPKSTANNDKDGAEPSTADNITTNISAEAVAELQARLDTLTLELAKTREVATNQKTRAEKAERAYKETAGDKDKRIDELAQQLEIAQRAVDDRNQKLQELTNAQRLSAVQSAVMGNDRVVDTARNDLASIVSGRLGIVDGVVVAVTDKGTARLSAKTGKPMTVAELVDEALSERPYMQKAATGGGTGASGKTSAGGTKYTKEQLLSMNHEDLARAWKDMSQEERQIFQ